MTRVILVVLHVLLLQLYCCIPEQQFTQLLNFPFFYFYSDTPKEPDMTQGLIDS